MFKCSKCAKCCKNLNKSLIYSKLDRGDGVCKYLSKNLCGIYSDRPLLCRVDESYYIFFKNLMTINEYYKINHKVCNELKNK